MQRTEVAVQIYLISLLDFKIFYIYMLILIQTNVNQN
jgi:hypothetical protein